LAARPAAVPPGLLHLLLPEILELVLLIFNELTLVSEIGVSEHQVLYDVLDLVGVIILELPPHQRKLHALLIHFFLVLYVEFMG